MKAKSKRYSIQVHEKSKRYGEPGKLLEVIKRTLHAEMIGNFNPFFCNYKGEKHLVSSLEGDLSDPFRRTESYADSFYIEV